MSYTGPFPFSIPQGGTNKTAIPSFFAYLSTVIGNVTGDNNAYVIPFDTAVFNNGGGFNTGTGIFTAPVTGNYLFTATATVALFTSPMIQSNASFKVNASVDYFFNYSNPFATANSNQVIWNGSTIISLTSGDTVEVNISVGNDTPTCEIVGGIGTTNFGGYLLI